RCQSSRRLQAAPAQPVNLGTRRWVGAPSNQKWEMHHERRFGGERRILSATGKTMSNGNVTGRKPLLNRRQVAELLNIHERTVARMEAAGRLPAIRIGDQTIRFDADAIDRFLAEHTRAAA